LRTSQTRMCGILIGLDLKTEFGVNLFVNKLKEQKVDESGKRSCQLSDMSVSVGCSRKVRSRRGHREGCRGCIPPTRPKQVLK